MLSEREAREQQQALLDYYSTRTGGSRSPQPTHSSSSRKRTEAKEPTQHRARRGGDPESKKLDDQLDLDLLKAQMFDMAQKLWLSDSRDGALSKAVRNYARSGSPNLRLAKDPKPAPKAERWDEGLALYRRPALRMTRTPGRRRSKLPNCISLGDLIKPESMLGMYSNTFLLEFDFLAAFLPILDHPHAERPVPLLLGQPMSNDPFVFRACLQAGIEQDCHKPPNLNAPESEVVAPLLSKIYQEVIGRNYLAIHPKCAGCSHSKIFVVRYIGFVLVVITSANTMKLDMELCDNHWYIQAFPELSRRELENKKRTKPPASEFERTLLYHLNELECPEEFIDLLETYDYSLASDINLVVSSPGVASSNEFDLLGIGRLAKIARDLLKDEERDSIRFEVCCGSLGAMRKEWLDSVEWLLRGKDPARLERRLRRRLKKEKEKQLREDEEEEKQNRRGETEPKKKKLKRVVQEEEQEDGEEGSDETEDPVWKIVFPPKGYVATLSPEVKETASNISSYWKTENWSTAPRRTKRLFHQYRSKERGRLFHEKSILWLSRDSDQKPEPSSSSSSSRSPPPPLLFYLGSHNFSSAAWGTPAVYRSSNQPGLKSENINNYEIGIVVKGDKIVSMLEKGSIWEDIVTYERPFERFGPEDIPWVSPTWVKETE